MSKRNQEIKEAIAKLESFKNDPAYAKDLYAIDENIVFLKSIKHLASYFGWLVSRSKKIAPARLLELTDFPVEEWDVKMHRRLMEIERNKFIGVGKPLVDKIVASVAGEKRAQVLVNLGAGGMEVDRQAIAALLEKKYAHPLIVIGVDKSPVSRALAKENMSSLGSAVKVIECGELTHQRLNEIEAANKGIAVILCKNDIFTLDRDFPPAAFDLMYHSLFKHHLAPELRPRLDALMKKLAHHVYEYDGYRTWGVIVPQTVVAWNYPFFLSGTVLSNIRFDKEAAVRERAAAAKSLAFYPGTGHYLLEP
jgi:hypothetical protein